mmetsp:Transcript_5220/g.8602  ORF Transcript_5220/g.8602 Transcript_5220/m.8602 type:complete len:391 (+) Transcript_5220:100-1272(+)
MPASLQQKALLIQKVLAHLYPNPPVPLNHFDHFSFLVAVVLSAQTTDGKVNEVTKELFQVAPTPAKLRTMTPQAVESIIKTVGLAPSKAKYLVGLSDKLERDFGGQVPRTYKELESLPGVGHKTASVIMSQAFGEPAIAVDTHVHRLALRWGLSADKKNVNKVQQDLCSVFPSEHWTELHLQMIYFGREYCTAKNHVDENCPVCSWVNRHPLQPPDFLSSTILSNRFSPQKKTKGIVHYSDRALELVSSPSLVCTPPAPAVVVKQEPGCEVDVRPAGLIMESPPPRRRKVTVKKEAEATRAIGGRKRKTQAKVKAEGAAETLTAKETCRREMTGVKTEPPRRVLRSRVTSSRKGKVKVKKEEVVERAADAAAEEGPAAKRRREKLRNPSR